MADDVPLVHDVFVSLHSMMSVLPNGGRRSSVGLACRRKLHSMMSVLLNGGMYV